MQQKDQFLTIAEAAQLLKVSKTSLRRWSNNGQLRCYRVGHRGERRFRHDELLEFVYGSDGWQGGSPVPEQDTGEPETPLKIRPPCHVCTMFKDEDDQWCQIRPYLVPHLIQGTKTVYVYHGERLRILERLRKEEGIDGQYLIAKGRLELLSFTETYLAGGTFDGNRLFNSWKETIDRHGAAGTKKLLLTGEMAWRANEFPGYEKLVEYESLFDELLRNYPWITVVCQYSLPNIPAPVVFDSLCLHRYVQLSDRVVPGLNFRTAK